MYDVILYIDNERMDMYGNETIFINDSIKDPLDLALLKTGFTKDFLLPATPTNNLKFAYYQDPAVVGSFDARYTTDAAIKINGVTFRKGKVRLLKVNIKDNEVVSYTVNFVGNTITLKDELQDDLLEQLDLSTYDHTYSEANVRTGLQSSLSSGAIRYPLLYHTTRYVYTTSFGKASDASALDYVDLKPAIQLTKILDAIESKYTNITWKTSEFFDETDFAKLYMWLHRDKGNMKGGTSRQVEETPYSDWSYSSGGGDITPIVTSDPRTPPDFTATADIDYDIKFSVVPNDSSLYDVKIIDEITGNTMATWNNQSGNTTFTTSASSGASRTWEPKLQISTTDGLASYTATLQLIKYETGQADITSNYTNGVGTYNIISQIFINEQMPKMKCIDFLSGLIKMFNLVMWVDSNDEIVVQDWDAYYAGGATWDLTKHIDPSYTVERPVPYGKIRFAFAEPKAKLLEAWNREFGELTNDEKISPEFGNLEYTDNTQRFDGEEYEVELPFEKMLYEAQFNSSDIQTDLTSGLFLNSDDEPEIGEPLVMYIVNTSCNTTQIRWASASNSTTYNRPSNTSSTQTINFNAEIDEHTLTLDTNSLFDTYYSDFIGDIFDRYQRKYTFKGRLPLEFISQYELRDTIRIGNKKFRIVSLKINLQNGESTLKLVNIV